MPAPHSLEISGPGGWQFVEILDHLDLLPVVRLETYQEAIYRGPRVSSATVCCLFSSHIVNRPMIRRAYPK